VLAPFLATRAALVLVAWFSEVFVASPRYRIPNVAGRGWQFTSWRLLDVWGRWDSGWYMDIALNWYSRTPSFKTHPSTIAFFPLYPACIRGVLWLLGEHNRTAAMLVGVAISNGALLVALVAIRQLVAGYAGGHSGRRAVLYVVTFPTGFFLSCFYPESLFLAATALACLFARRNRWLMASVAGAAAALSRPYGIAILLPLLWLYLSSRGWRIRSVRAEVVYLLLVPAALVGTLLLLRPFTGHFLAPFEAQAAWHRHLTWPWKTLVSAMYFEGPITFVQQCLAVGAVALSLWALVRLPSRAYGLYALAITIPSLLSGTLMGIGRHVAVVLPLYMMLAVLSRRERAHLWVQSICLAVQIAFMAAWVGFYPVV
jgi:Gpi18-like mannosyltransferase